MTEPRQRIRACYTDRTITVYQAYAPTIGRPAARDRGVSRRRGTRPHDLDQAVVPVEDVPLRVGHETAPGDGAGGANHPGGRFAWALRHACLSHDDPAVHTDHDSWRQQLRRSCARLQWDPGRNLRLRPLPHRSLQLGLAGEAARR